MRSAAGSTTVLVVGARSRSASLVFRYRRAGRRRARAAPVAASSPACASWSSRIVASDVVATTHRQRASPLNVGERHRCRWPLTAIPIAIGIAILQVPPLRHRRRDQQDGRLRRARRVHHARLRRDRRRASVRWSGAAASRTSRSRSPRPRSWRSAFQPVRERVAAVREPARLREARDALRGARGVLRADGRARTRPRTCCPRMARILAEATGAARADVWLRVDDRLPVDASWPDATPSRSAPVDADPLARRARHPVRHQGELLGALSIEKKPGEADHTDGAEADRRPGGAGRTGAEERRADRAAARPARGAQGVAAAAGRGAGRGAAQARAQHPRRRAAAAGGARGEAAAGRARSIGKRRRQARGHARPGCSADTSAALEDLRDLARGIYPPLLADKGLAAALEAQARKAAVPDDASTADGIGRFRAGRRGGGLLLACWRRCRTSRSTPSASAGDRSRSTNGDGRSRFAVTDDGAGFDGRPPGHARPGVRPWPDAHHRGARGPGGDGIVRLFLRARGAQQRRKYAGATAAAITLTQTNGESPIHGERRRTRVRPRRDRLRNRSAGDGGPSRRRRAARSRCAAPPARHADRGSLRERPLAPRRIGNIPRLSDDPLRRRMLGCYLTQPEGDSACSTLTDADRVGVVRSSPSSPRR